MMIYNNSYNNFIFLLFTTRHDTTRHDTTRHDTMDRFKASFFVCGTTIITLTYINFKKHNIQKQVEFHRNFNGLSQAIKNKNINDILSYCDKPDPQPIFGNISHQVNSKYNKFITQRDADCVILRKHLNLANNILQNYHNFKINYNNDDANYHTNRILNETEDLKEQLNKLL